MACDKHEVKLEDTTIPTLHSLKFNEDKEVQGNEFDQLGL